MESGPSGSPSPSNGAAATKLSSILNEESSRSMISAAASAVASSASSSIISPDSDLGELYKRNVTDLVRAVINYRRAACFQNYVVSANVSEDIWKGFNWSERFPGQKELMSYFNYVDSKMNFRKDIQFNTRVTAATFDQSRKQWFVQTENQESIWVTHLVLCIGFASRRYTPSFPGLETFKGMCHHSSLWPSTEVNLKGKRVAVIGTGASGVQIIQEIGPIVSKLIVYQRTPNIALPMQQCKAKDQAKWWDPALSQEDIFQITRKTFAGFTVDFSPVKWEDASPEERRALWEDLYTRGGFALWLSTYQEIFMDQAVNDAEYAFWAEKTRARIHDPVKKNILAPLKPPHAFGTKRPSLEQAYYEVFNQPNVDIINVRDTPILEVTPEGVKTQKEGVIPVDVLILATGFDTMTGGIFDIKILNGEGTPLEDKWKMETCTALGLCTSRYPNLYFPYGPQGPTAFANGPTAIDIQTDWITKFIAYMKDQGIQALDVSKEFEDRWTKEVRDLWAASLFPATDSWYQGANIQGKTREALNYFGGVPKYSQALDEVAQNNYKDFVVV